MSLGIFNLIRMLTCHLFRTRPVTIGDVDRRTGGTVGTKDDKLNEISESVSTVETDPIPVWNIVSVSDEKLILHSTYLDDELYFI